MKKAELGSRETFILRLEAILLALVAGGLFILIIGQNPFVIYKTIITGALRSGMAIQATVKIAIPLLIASLGVTLAFKMKFWNIGAEGQIIAGGICASYFALFHSGWNHWVLVIVMFIAGAVGGRTLGPDSGLVQDKIRYERDSVHIDVEIILPSILSCS